MSTNSWVGPAKARSGWLIIAGVLGMIAGVLAFCSPFIAGLAVAIVVGFAMMVGGTARIVGAFAAESFGTGALAFLWGLLMSTTGFYFIINPDVGLGSLTLVLSMVFFAVGVIESIVGFQMRPAAGWGWTLFAGILTVLLAFMIWRQFPTSGVWLVGTMVGINLFTNGISSLMIGLGIRSATE